MLPEYHLTGWVPKDSAFAEIAARAHTYVTRYQALAKELKINLVPGTIVQTAPESLASPKSDGSATAATNGAATGSQQVLLNIAPFISYTGELLGTYTKMNLWHPERPYLTAPDYTLAPPHQILETPLGPLGILVCWDLAFPEAFRALVRQGARIVVVPTFWMATDASDECLRYNPNAEALFLNATLTARAYESTAAVIFVNAGGPKEDGYLGLSQVAMPLVGPVKGSFTDAHVDMKILDVDMEILDAAERNYKVREDLAREDWHYGYSHPQNP